MAIWVNEQIDPCGIVYSCIACQNEITAKDCHDNWQNSLTEKQKQNGWIASLRTVESWDEVPITTFRLNC